MKKVAYSVVLVVTIAAGVAMAPAFAGEARNDPVMKSSDFKKSRQIRPTVKRTTTEADYYTRAREMQMKISM
ncbi:MAG: hypothetical protein ACRECA_08140 [Pseudolabrys sp.]